MHSYGKKHSRNNIDSNIFIISFSLDTEGHAYVFLKGEEDYNAAVALMRHLTTYIGKTLAVLNPIVRGYWKDGPVLGLRAAFVPIGIPISEMAAKPLRAAVDSVYNKGLRTFL